MVLQGREDPLANTQKGGAIMKLTIVGRQMNVRSDLKELVTKKLAKFDKFFADDTSATVTFSRQKSKECLEITILSNGTIFRSEKKDVTFNCALDQCMDSIERQIRKNKTRLERRLREGAFVPENFEYAASDVEEEKTFDMIRVKEFDLKPLSTEEAILQMNLLGHQFFVFKDSHTMETCVVYNRADGGYGLIVPKK